MMTQGRAPALGLTAALLAAACQGHSPPEAHEACAAADVAPALYKRLLPLDFALSSDPAESSPRPRRIRLGKAPRPGLRAGHHPLPKMWRPHARPRGRLRPRRHRPHLARRPRSACASSSRPAPVAPLTARPFGDVFTLRAPLPASLPLSGSSRHISSRARFPSRLGPCQNLPTAGSAAAHRAPPNSPSPPNSCIELLKRDLARTLVRRVGSRDARVGYVGSVWSYFADRNPDHSFRLRQLSLRRDRESVAHGGACAAGTTLRRCGLDLLSAGYSAAGRAAARVAEIGIERTLGRRC
jgi:hypothetical protein